MRCPQREGFVFLLHRRVDRDDHPRADIPKLLELAASGQVDLDAVVSNTYPLEAVNDGYADMRTGKFLRGVLRYPAAG